MQDDVIAPLSDNCPSSDDHSAIGLIAFAHCFVTQLPSACEVSGFCSFGGLREGLGAGTRRTNETAKRSHADIRESEASGADKSYHGPLCI